MAWPRRAQGVSDEVVGRELSHIAPGDRATAVNKLVSSKRVQLFEQGPNKALVIKEISAEEAAK